MTDTPVHHGEGGWVLSRQARRNILRTAQFIAVVLVINFLVLPRLSDYWGNVDSITDVEPLFLLAGVGLELAALLGYAQLTRAALPPNRVSLFRMFRIQLATKSITNVVPGGSAAGSALGYRLLTVSGVAGADAGFAIASVGLASAVVLNVLFWVALLASIIVGDSNGNRMYTTAAIAGVFLLLLVAGLILTIARGQNQTHRAAAWLERRFRFIDGMRLGQVIERLRDRLNELGKSPRLLRKAAMWASLNWILDALALGVFLRAYGETPNLVGLMVAFSLANVIAVIPLTPGGLGVFEVVLIPSLIGFGVSPDVAVKGVAIYRFVQWFLPIPFGALAYLSVRKGPQSLPFRRVAEEAYESPQSQLDWMEHYGRRDRVVTGEAAVAVDTTDDATGDDAVSPPTVDLTGEDLPEERSQAG